MGHLTNVANNVVQSVEKGKNKTTLEAIFNGKSILESLMTLLIIKNTDQELEGWQIVLKTWKMYLTYVNLLPDFKTSKRIITVQKDYGLFLLVRRQINDNKILLKESP